MMNIYWFKQDGRRKQVKYELGLCSAVTKHMAAFGAHQGAAFMT